MNARSDLAVRSLILSCVLLAPSAAAQSLEAFVMAVGGESTGGPECWGGGPPPSVQAYFGSGGLNIPNGGLAHCTVAGGPLLSTSPSGPLADSMTLSTSWNAGANVLGAATDVLADYGTLASASHASFTFTSGNGSLTYAGAESYGLQRDGLTFTSSSVANGQSGSMSVVVTALGNLAVAASGTADVELAYRVNGGGVYTLFRSQANGTALPFLTSITGNGLSGFALSPGAMGGSGEFESFAIPIVFGTELDFDLGLFTYVLPGLTITAVDADFRAVLSGFRAFGPGGQELTDFAVASTSGTAYGAGGLLPVSYCTPGTSASGCQATLSASGTPSATAATGFLVHAGGVEGSKDGLFFFGTSGRQANSWGNGTSYQCVVPPVKRGAVIPGTGTAGACDGLLQYDLNARWQAQPSKNPGAGAVVETQLWFRDPLSTSNQSTSLSDALEFPVGP